MHTVMSPREEGSVATVATSGGEDTAPATITTTLYDLIAALQAVVEPGEDVLVVATVVSLLRAGRIRSVVGGLGQESAYSLRGSLGQATRCSRSERTGVYGALHGRPARLVYPWPKLQSQ